MQIVAIKPIVARFGNRPRVLVKVETDEIDLKMKDYDKIINF